MPIPLTYHDVAPAEGFDETGFAGALAARYKLTPREFATHLEAIAATGITVSTSSGTTDGQTKAAVGSPDAVWLTFDDGGKSSLRVADMLESYGWRGMFFVTVGRIDDDPAFLDRDEIRSLSERGHTIGSHSYSHPTYMARLDETGLLEEWQRSRDALSEILGERPACASVPGGYLSPLVIDTARQAGYTLLLTSEPDERPRNHSGMTVIGRYSIWASTPARTAAAYAEGRMLARLKLRLEWKAKHSAKSASPRLYDLVRKLRA